MPKRISFHVVYATSEDSGYPACELNAQGPAARGWRSSGPPPHELLLRLTSVARIHQLQLLAHHQLVPATVEVLVSGGLTTEGAATPCGATYCSVGLVALAQPLHEARTRELRSAALPEPTIARFVKLKMSAPHPPGDVNDQVALMAVNVLGEEIEESSDNKKGTSSPPSEQLSPYDDLAFVMYVDTEIAEIIRKLDARKKDAIADERFEYARRLKSCSEALASAGVRVGRWRLRKRLAVERDDFELARRMRDRLTDALTGLQNDEDLCKLLEEEGPDTRNDSSMLEEYDFSHYLAPTVPFAMSFDIPSPHPTQFEEEIDHHEQTHKTKIAKEQAVQALESVTYGLDEKDEIIKQESMIFSIADPPSRAERIEVEKPLELRKIEEGIRRENESPRRSITPNSANGGTLVRRRHKSAGPRPTYESYDECPLPTLRHSHTNEYLRECGKDGREEEGSATGSATGSHTPVVRPPHKLNERERKLAALPIIIFGYPLVEKFFSKTFLDKEEGLNRLKSELSNQESSGTKTSPNKTARAAAILLQRSIRDKVFSVYSQANEVVKLLFLEFMPERVCSAEVGRCLEKLLPELLRACGDPAPRIHSTAQHTVLTIADCPHVRSLHIIPQQLVRPVQASMHPRLALSRLQMLEQLLLSHGISTEKNSGLTVRRLAECGAAGTQHASGAVRAAAERILLVAYNRSPRVVKAQLPPDDAVTRRNLIYRHIFQQFDKIDMQKILNQAPTDENINNISQHEDSTLETSSMALSLHSGMTSTMSGLTSSMGMTSSYSLKSMASSTGASTLAASSLGSSSTKTKSSLKKTTVKRYSTNYSRSSYSPGYNKLRLDSAVSPKLSPKGSTEKVHFKEPSQEVVYRRVNRHNENRHSMIHFDHEAVKPKIKERPLTVYEPLHRSEYNSPSIGSPKASRFDLRSLDSISIDSPKSSRADLDTLCRKRSDFQSNGIDSPRGQDFGQSQKVLHLSKLHIDKSEACDRSEAGAESPRMAASMRSLHLDEMPMDESGYYSPGERGEKQVSKSKSGNNMAEYCDQYFDSLEGIGMAGDVSSDGTTPEPTCTKCTWCSRTVRAGGLDAHYWRRCVVLARCQHCHQVLEARNLHPHLLDECTMSAGVWRQCPQCRAALRGDEGDYHSHCIRAGADEWKCPYCLVNVLARDQPWQRHLLQCPRNPRVLRANI